MKTTDKSVWESGEKRIHLTLGTIAEVIGAVLPEGMDPNRSCRRVLTQSVYATDDDDGIRTPKSFLRHWKRM